MARPLTRLTGPISALWSATLVLAGAWPLIMAALAFSAAPPAKAPLPGDATPERVVRTRAQVEALIAAAGRTPPAWWDGVQLTYPPTLDLTWKKSQGWDNQRNVGQYIWDIVDPNPGRWKEGVKLVHHVLSVNQNNPEVVQQAIQSLSHLYAHLLEDYPRAAFWGRKHGRDAILLADCYWKMGSKEMASEILLRIQGDPTRNCTIVKLWSDMGDLDRAIRIAEQEARQGRPVVAYLAAADVCRKAGRYPQALGYYEKALANDTNPKATDAKMNGQRARAGIEAIKVFESLDLSRIADGQYKASSYAFTGPLEITVNVKSARIENVQVSKHTEKQFYSSITDTTRQIIQKQSLKGVDTTSGATVTSEAIIQATAKALASGMK
jgi:uncharacterized protein with FMN-binding domain